MKLGVWLLIPPAAFGLFCGALLLTGQVPEWLVDAHGSGGGPGDPTRAALEPGAPGGATDTDAPGAATTARASATPGSASTTGAPLELVRTRVCERGEALPTLQALSSTSFLVHCGTSAHLIAFEVGAFGLAPRRIARFEVEDAGRPGLPHPGTALSLSRAADDARADLWLTSLRVDGTAAPIGGALYRARRSDSRALELPERVLTPAPGALVAAELDGAPGSELVALQLGSTRTARAAELWVLDSGPAPARGARLTAAPSTSALAALDLDGDGRDDLVAAAPGEGQVQLWLSSQKQPTGEAPPLSLALAGASQLLAVDRDGDGRAELFALGETLVRIGLDGTQPSTETLGEAEGVRSLQAHDVDADGRPELLGYRHPALLELGERAHELMRIEGDGVSIAAARLAHLDADGKSDLLVLAVGDAADGGVELAFAAGRAGVERARLSRRAEPLRDAPLSLALPLP